MPEENPQDFYKTPEPSNDELVNFVLNNIDLEEKLKLKLIELLDDTPEFKQRVVRILSIFQRGGKDNELSAGFLLEGLQSDLKAIVTEG